MEFVLTTLNNITNPTTLSVLLVILVAGDTLASLMWRAKKNHAIFSKSLGLGLLFNMGVSLIPYLVTHLTFLELGKDSEVIRAAMVIWTVFFGSATAFSFVANYKLYSAESYAYILDKAPNILTNEIKRKIEKVEKYE